MNTALQSPLQTGLGSRVLTGAGDAWIAPNKFFFPLPYKVHFQSSAKKTDGQKKILPTASIVPSTKCVGFPFR